jgi:predicted O-methyltransferase YrrM
LFDPQAPAPALHALERAQQCASGYPEAHIFHSLIAGHHAATASGDGVALKYAKQLTDHAAIHPQLRDFADAASHVLCELGGSRLFSSARDTLLYAASQASAAGSCVELGVFHGVSLGWLVACRSWQVHGFDSFAGLPSDWEGVPQGTFTTAGRVPEGLDAQFWVGAFEEQLPEYVAKHTEPIALLHIDSDLYESARSGLAHLGPLLRAGSVLVFDEYLGHRNWRQGEYRAFQEVVEHYGWHCEPLAVNPFTGQAVFRLAP